MYKESEKRKKERKEERKEEEKRFVVWDASCLKLYSTIAP